MIIKKILSVALFNPISAMILLLPVMILVGLLVDLYVIICFGAMALTGGFNKLGGVEYVK